MSIISSYFIAYYRCEQTSALYACAQKYSSNLFSQLYLSILHTFARPRTSEGQVCTVMAERNRHATPSTMLGSTVFFAKVYQIITELKKLDGWW